MSRRQVEDVTQGRISLARYVNKGKPDFTAGTPGAAMWAVVQGDVLRVYRSQGLTVTQTIQCALGVAPDGWWGPRTQAALRRALERRGWLYEGLARDGEITADTLAAALAVAFNTPFSLAAEPAEDTVLFPGTDLPYWMGRSFSDGEYNGITWRSEFPTTPRVPAATLHPAYGTEAICSRLRRNAYLVNVPAVHPAGNLALDAAMEPAQSVLHNGPQTTGDSPGGLAQMAGGMVLIGVGIITAIIFDDP